MATPGKTHRSIASLAPVSFADWGQRGRGTRATMANYPGRRTLSACLPWAGMCRAFSASAASRQGMPGARVDPRWPHATARAESPHHGWETGARRIGRRAREWTPTGLMRRRGLKARTTAARRARDASGDRRSQESRKSANQSQKSGVIPHGPESPHGPIHGIMPHES